MSALVIDSSIALSFVLPDEDDEIAKSAMEIVASRGALAPLHWPLEVANGLLVAQRRQRMDDASRRKSLHDFAALPIELDVETNAFAWNDIGDLAERYRLTAYDAAYLELAMRARLPLATLDNELISAARKARVAIFGKP
ncbi:MAG: type II toxin-antitoxin system VapC family toxin [Rhizomicrobium sp.]|jgi:predicted nucleic acid-binding protein